jgi:hypothetical protein
MGADGKAQVKADIDLAISKSNEFWRIASQNSNPDGDPTAVWASMTAAWLIDQFLPEHDWDFKSRPELIQRYGSLQTRNLGNLNFGAVLAALGASYYLTQNAAGIAQLGINIRYSQGIPLFVFPYGDSVQDAAQIRKGYDLVTSHPECLQ